MSRRGSSSGPRRAGAGAPRPVPLARLFAIAYRHLIERLHERLARAGYRDVRPSFGYVLLAVRDEPAPTSAVAELLGVTKQAASQVALGLEQAGYVRRRTHPGDARSTLLELTPRGRKFLETVEAIYDELESEWAAVTGRQRLEAMRDDLEAVLEAAHDGALPRVRPTP